MKINVKYIGVDTKYFERLKKRYAQEYPNLRYNFSQLDTKKEKTANSIYQKIYAENIHVVLIDFDSRDLPNFAPKLCKLINSNAEFRKKSLCALHSYCDGEKTIPLALNSEVRLNHFKGIELFSIVYNTISFIDVSLAKKIPFITGDDIGEYEASLDIKMSYIKNDMYHVETSVKLPENEVIEINHHPLNHLFYSNRFYVSNFMNENLFYQTRYSYDLEFTYIQNTFFEQTEKDWLIYKDLKEKTKSHWRSQGHDYDLIHHHVRKRKNKIRDLRSELRDWVNTHKNENVKKVKVMIFDDELSFFEKLDSSEKYIVRYETGLIYDYYQIRRFNPHLIIINKTSKHDAESIKKLLEYLENQKNDPYVIVLNSEDQFLYHKVTSFAGMIDVKDLDKLVESFETRVDISNNTQRVFFGDKHKNLVAKFSFGIDIIALNESTLYFKSKIPIEPYSVINLNAPVKMLLTIVPDIDDSEFNKDEEVYRALINALDETQRKKLRVIINQSLVEDDSSQD